jgi:hypothetical protein
LPSSRTGELKGRQRAIFLTRVTASWCRELGTMAQLDRHTSQILGAREHDQISDRHILRAG